MRHEEESEGASGRDFSSLKKKDMEKGSINLLLKILELGCDVWCCGSYLKTMRGDIAIALRISEQKDKNIDNITDLLYKA